MTDAEKIAKLESEVKMLREQVDLLLRKFYGTSSEKLDPGQLELLLDPEAAKKPPAAGPDEGAPAAEEPHQAPGQADPKTRAPRRRRPELPEDIEVVEEIVEPEEVAQAPTGWQRIGQEVSERLEFEPARVWLKRIVRPTYVKRVRRYASPPTTAPLAPCVLEGSLLSPSLAAQILTGKYADHLPYYRQAGIFERRHGVRIGRNTLCHWSATCARWLEPLHRLLAAELRSQAWLGVDETPIEYLAPGHGRTKLGYLWAYQNPQVGVLYDWHPGRAHGCLDRVLLGRPERGRRFGGTLLTDGFIAYSTWAAKHGGVTLAACWAHVRRKFHEAAGHYPKEAAPFLEKVGQLFSIEADLARQRAGPGQVHSTRQRHSAPIIDSIRAQLTTAANCLPKSTLGKARAYTLGLWARLAAFLDDPGIPIHNNGIENAIRPTKLGAKNWLFIGREDTGQNSAVLYTMVENIRAGGGDPFTYLEDVLTRLPAMTNRDDLRPLLPLNWLRRNSIAPAGSAAA